MTNAAPALLDRFMPSYAVRGRHQVTVRAPAALVMQVARDFEIESIWLVRTLFNLRARLLGVQPKAQQRAGFVDQMQKIGWGRLTEESDQYFAAGATCRPWQADPGFSPVAPELFAAFNEPYQVKIAWTLEAVEVTSAITRFATETRAEPTDEAARIKFHRYWRKFGAGIVLIRLVLLPAIRRRAERLWRESAES
jgi:hypothetical protein